MATHDYFPTTETEFPRWYSNFSDKFGSLYAVGLGMSGEVAGLQDDAAMVTYLVNKYKDQFDTGRTTVTNFANKMLGGQMEQPTQILPYPLAPSYGGPMVAPGIIGRTRALVGRIKSANGYTAEMGRDMGLVTPETDQEMSAPDLDITAMAGLMIKVRWRKGEADALELMLNFGNGYPKRGQRFTRTPFETEVELPDGLSAPMQATVKARYIEDDKPIGDFGPEYTVTLRP